MRGKPNRVTKSKYAPKVQQRRGLRVRTRFEYMEHDYTPPLKSEMDESNSLSAALNRFGADGWELMFMSKGELGTASLVFKRARTGGRVVL